MAHERDGGAIRAARKPILDPEATARKVAELTFHRLAAQKRRQAAAVTLLEGLSGMGLEELRRHSTTRQWLVAAAEATGASNKEIAAIANLSGEVSAHRAKKHPVVRRLVELIREHQLGLVLRGEYGTQAIARAASPAIVQHLTELAGAARPDAEGKRLGRAKRDADTIKAGEVVLDIAGHKVQRQAHLHVHQVYFDQMTESELELYARDGTWPERFQALPVLAPAGTDLPFTPTTPACPAPEKDPLSRAKTGPIPGGRRRP